MCEYCSETEKRKYLLERTLYGSSDCYIGIDMCIEENRLEIEAVGEVGYPSKDNTIVEDNKIINYCPMCGRKLMEE